MDKQPYATFEDGAKMPLMAFGTLMDSRPPDFDPTVDIIKYALDVGYRHLDTAMVYKSESCVGKAVNDKIKDGTLWREDVFVTTKLWRNSYAQEDVVPALKKSLSELGLTYVDLYLIHWPTAFRSGANPFPKDENGSFVYSALDYVETWKGMEECVDLGLAKHIGLSNFNSKQIKRILDTCRIKPVNNQIESHPYLNNRKLIEYCQDKGITCMAYAPLAGYNAKYRQQEGWPTIYTDKRITDIAAKNKMTPAQVALAYQIQREVGAAPKSARKSRIEENFKALNFILNAEDIKVVENCDANLRLNHEFPDHPNYPFHEEF